jgi:hypothetical protein
MQADRLLSSQPEQQPGLGHEELERHALVAAQCAYGTGAGTARVGGSKSNVC